MSRPFCCPHCTRPLPPPFVVGNAGHVVACPHCRRELEMPAMAVLKNVAVATQRIPPGQIGGSTALAWVLTLGLMGVGALAIYNWSEHQRLKAGQHSLEARVTAIAYRGAFSGGDEVLPSISVRRIRILNDQGKQVASLGASGQGCYCTFQGQNGKVALSGDFIMLDGPGTRVAVTGTYVGVHRRDSANNHVSVNSGVYIGFPEGPGGGVVDVFNAAQKRVASIQANKEESGAVYVTDSQGVLRNAVLADRP